MRIQLNPRWRNWSTLFVVLAAVTLVWCYSYDRWTSRAWTTPIGYSGDGWGTLALFKAAASGDILPFLPKYPHSLGAPFRANWNDYPSVEEGLIAGAGFLSWVFGLFAGSNATVLIAHLLAAASFLFVCRQLRYDLIPSAAGAIIFALSRYSFVRGFQHIGLTMYWHVPLGLLVLFWFYHGDRFIRDRRKMIWSLLIGFVHGIQNPYYSAMFVQLLAGLTIFHFFARTSRFVVVRLIAVQCVVVGAFLLANADTFYQRLAFGDNPAAIARAYSDLEMYALKPLEFFLPVGHRWSWLNAWAQRGYYTKALFLGEAGSPYLGFVGIFALGLLLWQTLKTLAKKPAGDVPLHVWGILWVSAFAITGGVNGLVGTAGIVLFRSSNRYSIVILALLLLYLTKRATAFFRRWDARLTGTTAAALCAFAAWDQVPFHETDSHIKLVRDFVSTDARFVRKLESTLPASAMVFQLPVMEWPEVPPIRELHDYEQFRPYLHSHHLRFSYGSSKGRAREQWQVDAVQVGPPRMINLLEQYGFSAILISRAAFDDGGAAIRQGLAQAGRSSIIAESNDFTCIALTPSPTQLLPPEFHEWYGLESDAKQNWRWSSGASTILLRNNGAEPQQVRITAGIDSLTPRRVQVSDSGKLLASVTLNPARGAEPIDFSFALQPGTTTLEFSVDVPGEQPETGDPRKLAFRLIDFSFASADQKVAE